MLQGMLLAEQAGAVEATVVSDGTPGNGALRLYESVGFREYTRDVTLLKPATRKPGNGGSAAALHEAVAGGGRTAPVTP